MTTDFSKILYEKYFKLNNRLIQIKLDNGEIINGTIKGFFKGEEDFNEPYILKWRIEIETDNLGSELKKTILLNSVKIKEVLFFEDNSTLILKK